MTDRELLEKAAKAAGINILYGRFQNYPVLVTGKEKDGDPVVPWNPLTDDGDALRLAVKLGIGVLFDIQDERVTAFEQAPHDGYHVEFADDQDPCAATRRAVVRAAAAIGEKE